FEEALGQGIVAQFVITDGGIEVRLPVQGFLFRRQRALGGAFRQDFGQRLILAAGLLNIAAGFLLVVRLGHGRDSFLGAGLGLRLGEAHVAVGELVQGLEHLRIVAILVERLLVIRRGAGI